MRVSIWQQFSSNHSADFTVVGVFNTPEAANKAAEELRDVLRTIQNWYRQPENEEVIEKLHGLTNEQGAPVPTPIETELGKRYGFEWIEQAPDFLWYQLSSDATQAVAAWEQILFVESYLTGERTWSGVFPIAKLVEKLGGKSFMYDGMSADGFWFKLSCIAPDESAANLIDKLFNLAQDHDDTQVKDIPKELLLSGKLSRNELELEFQIWEIGILSDDLPMMIDYLRNHGCTQIKYEFFEGTVPF
jgi:hypothetical protein